VGNQIVRDIDLVLLRIAGYSAIASLGTGRDFGFCCWRWLATLALQQFTELIRHCAIG